jgi:non-canonical (house-cleaning) NTP pyrophosphatase
MEAFQEVSETAETVEAKVIPRSPANLSLKKTGRTDAQRREGTIGIFTKEKVKRKDLGQHGTLMALTKFLSPEIF